MKITSNLTHIATEVEFEAAKNEDELQAAFAAQGLPGFPAELDNAVLFLKTGVCGGFTTFSAFSLETLNLLESGKFATGAAYACGSVVVCLVGVALGRLTMRAIRTALTGSAEA